MSNQSDTVSTQGAQRRSIGAQLGTDLNSRPGSKAPYSALHCLFWSPPWEPLVACHAKHSPANALTAKCTPSNLAAAKSVLSIIHDSWSRLCWYQLPHAIIAADVPLYGSASRSIQLLFYVLRDRFEPSLRLGTAMIEPARRSSMLHASTASSI